MESGWTSHFSLQHNNGIFRGIPLGNNYQQRLYHTLPIKKSSRQHRFCKKKKWPKKEHLLNCGVQQIALRYLANWSRYAVGINVTRAEAGFRRLANSVGAKKLDLNKWNTRWEHNWNNLWTAIWVGCRPINNKIRNSGTVWEQWRQLASVNLKFSLVFLIEVFVNLKQINSWTIFLPCSETYLLINWQKNEKLLYQITKKLLFPYNFSNKFKIRCGESGLHRLLSNFRWLVWGLITNKK